MTNKITPSDEPLIREWLNCDTASVDAEGDVWVEGPMAGHWLKPERLAEFVAWRTAQLTTPVRWPVDDRLRRAGELLYGDRWQSDLARSMGVAGRTVRAWVAGERRIPPGVWADIVALLRQRQQDISALLQQIDEGV